MSQSGPRSCLGSPEPTLGGPCPSLRIPESTRAVPTQCLRLKPAVPVPTGQPRQRAGCVNMPAALTGRLRSGPASATGLLPQPATGRLRAAQNGRLRQRALCANKPVAVQRQQTAGPTGRLRQSTYGQSAPTGRPRSGLAAPTCADRPAATTRRALGGHGMGRRSGLGSESAPPCFTRTPRVAAPILMGVCEAHLASIPRA